MSFAARPTLYKGIQFRSRLEARWAAYFDHRGWHWVYEPFDLKGYTPDFLVRTYDPDEHPGLPTLEWVVEVKPATKIGQLAAPITRLLNAGWRGPWLVVGADPDIAMEGQGHHGQRRRFLATEAPEAWAEACNATQWRPESETAPACERCGKPTLFLHNLVCKP